MINFPPADAFPVHNTAETIFERLEAKGLTWRVYCDAPSPASMTGIIHASRLHGRFATNFFTVADFLADARDGRLPGLAAAGVPGLMQLLAATQCGMSTDEFAQTAQNWIETARHPKFGRLYTQCVYQPMLELLEYLRARDFEIYIVTGGGMEFVRPWAERVYGVPLRRVVGSSLKTKFEMRDDRPVLIRTSEINLVNDGDGKPVGIHEFIGQQPIAAFGNSDGDLEMLQWTASGSGARLILLVHHTDAEREYAYDAHSPFGALSKALDEAKARGWQVADMKRDWNTIFPPVTR